MCHLVIHTHQANLACHNTIRSSHRAARKSSLEGMGWWMISRGWGPLRFDQNLDFTKTLGWGDLYLAKIQRKIIYINKLKCFNKYKNHIKSCILCTLTFSDTDIFKFQCKRHLDLAKHWRVYGKLHKYHFYKTMCNMKTQPKYHLPSLHHHTFIMSLFLTFIPQSELLLFTQGFLHECT